MVLRADASSHDLDRTTVEGTITFCRLGVTKEDFWVYDNINQLKLVVMGFGVGDAAGSLEYTSNVVVVVHAPFDESNSKQNGTTPAQVANPDLRWESVAQLNVGAEIRAYDYLVFGFDVFNRKTNDMKTRPPLPDYIGNDPSTANVGSMLNQGIDMEFGYDRTYSKDFGYWCKR